MVQIDFAPFQLRRAGELEKGLQQPFEPANLFFQDAEVAASEAAGRSVPRFVVRNGP